MNHVLKGRPAGNPIAIGNKAYATLPPKPPDIDKIYYKIPKPHGAEKSAASIY